MKNKIIVFAIAMLLPSLTWACGAPSPVERMIKEITIWLTIIAVIPSLVTFIVLSRVIAFKKNQENKKLKRGIVCAVAFLVFSVVAYVPGTTAFLMAGFYDDIILLSTFLRLYSIIIISTIIMILILDLKCIKNKNEKRLKWWIRFTFSVLFLSLFALIVVNSIQTIAPLDSANF